MPLNRDHLDIFLSLVAIAVSLGAATFTYLQFKEAEHATATANAALLEAKRANDIALGNLNPEVCVDVRDKNVRITAPEKPAVYLYVSNCGDLQISGVDIHILPLAGLGLFYQLDDPRKEARPLSQTMHHKIDFPVVLSQEGLARINLAPLLEADIAKNIQDFADPANPYTGAFNVVVSPIRKGESVPALGSGKQRKDRIIVQVEFAPSDIHGLSSEEVAKAVGTPHIVQ